MALLSHNNADIVSSFGNIGEQILALRKSGEYGH